VRTAVVTGAFSNSGSAVAAELSRRGWSLRTLTNRTPPPGSIPAHPLRFERHALLAALHGADALVNTYWVRFPFHGVTFDTAIQNIDTLLGAAREAGVSRFVQISVSNASEDSTLGYYRGKAIVEQRVRESGLSFAILRPTLIVGPKDVLTNHIAWFLRRFPVFLLPAGDGHHLQPIVLDDLARIVADAVESRERIERDAAGPEIVTFGDYVRHVARAIDVRPKFVTASPSVVLTALGAAGLCLGDVVLSREELEGLRQDRLVSREPPLGRESVFAWLDTHAGELGRHYWNDTRTRFR
jgi:uncharacterized protein YbjT (DUF2867 family)